MKTKMKPISTAIVGREENNEHRYCFCDTMELAWRGWKDNLTCHDEMRSMKMPILVDLIGLLRID